MKLLVVIKNISYSQHISVKLKDNNKGVGFEGHDDTWLSHQNDFQVWIYFPCCGFEIFYF